MSRIGERKLVIPDGVTVSVNGNVVDVKGPKGELNLEFSKLVSVVVEDGVVLTKQIKPSKDANVMQGTTNSLISNMITGVSKGYDKGLEAVGVGYRFQVSGNKITINAGYSHPVVMEAPVGLTVTSESNTEITIHGIDKQKVSEFAANVRKVREPEPYKGKGIRYKGEQVRRKEGKKAA
ncbi:50S ribosomal protein L6 [Firmicutes bacterium CAG:460]|jgi:large subunit ribosomal protein L6|nr:50S ribosomal protein L6 [Firmicutes bacterium CAG:460]